MNSITSSTEFEMIDEFRCYAPKLARVNDGFSSASFETLYEREESNFWFRSRNNLILHLFKKYVGDRKEKVCEIGCGTGYVLNGLSSLKNLELSGSEIHLEGLKYARGRLPNLDFFQADATNLPFHNTFHAIGAFDVLEHIHEDEKAIASIYKSLKLNGLFFVTVPQFQWMWSVEDDVAFHKRRYSKDELVRKIKNAGFEILFINSFVFSLFPFMALQRLIGSLQLTNQNTATLGLRLPTLINWIFYLLTQADIYFIRLGVRLPWGGSLVTVAKKV